MCLVLLKYIYFLNTNISFEIRLLLLHRSIPLTIFPILFDLLNKIIRVLRTVFLSMINVITNIAASPMYIKSLIILGTIPSNMPLFLTHKAGRIRQVIVPLIVAIVQGMLVWPTVVTNFEVINDIWTVLNQMSFLLTV